MMSKRATAVLAAALLAPTLVFAQFSVPGFGSKSAGGDLVGQQTQIVTGYTAANKSVLQANAIQADALGLKDLAAKDNATADGLGAGTSKDGIADSDKATSDSTKQLQDAYKQNSGNLSDEAKKKFALSFAPLTAGVAQYVSLRTPVQNFATGLKSASPLDVPKLQTGAYIAQNFPNGLKNASDSLQNTIAFAKSHDIPVPADATAALNSAL